MINENQNNFFSTQIEVKFMVTQTEKQKRNCPNCGYAYESEEDLIESRYNENIWWLCPKCDKQI